MRVPHSRRRVRAAAGGGDRRRSPSWPVAPAPSTGPARSSAPVVGRGDAGAVPVPVASTAGTQPAADFTNCNDRVNRRGAAGRPAQARLLLRPHRRPPRLRQADRTHDRAATDQGPRPANTSGRTLLLNRGGPGAAASTSRSTGGRGSRPPCCSTTTSSASTRAASGLSTPIACFTDAQKDAANAASPDVRTAAGFAQAKAAAARFADACAAKYGSALADFDTVQTAHDMDRIRQALGDADDELPRLLLRHRARRRVRAPVPDEGRRDGARRRGGPADRRHRRRRQPARRASRSPSTSSPRGAAPHSPCTKLGDPREAVYNIVATARRAPIPSAQPGEKRRATVSLVLTGVLLALYSQSEWPMLGQALLAAEQGNSAGLLQLADAVQPAHQRALHEHRRRRNDDQLQRLASRARATRRSGRRRSPGSSGSRCSACGRRPTCSPASSGSPHRTVPPLPTAPTSAHTVLVLGNLHDPATPYEGAKDLTADARPGPAADVERRGAHVLPAGQLVHRRRRGRLPRSPATLPPNGKTCPR